MSLKDLGILLLVVVVGFFVYDRYVDSRLVNGLEQRCVRQQTDLYNSQGDKPGVSVYQDLSIMVKPADSIIIEDPVFGNDIIAIRVETQLASDQNESNPLYIDQDATLQSTTGSCQTDE